MPRQTAEGERKPAEPLESLQLPSSKVLYFRKARCLFRLMKHGLLSSCFLPAVLVASGLLPGNSAEPDRPGPLVGKTAPSFRVQGIYGESYSLDTFKGHILVMQFGSSW